MRSGIMNELERVEKNFDFLKILCKCNKKMRKSILENADKDLVATICECVYNCLNGNIELNADIKTKLKRHKETLRKLVGKKKSIKLKKQILNQRGGAFLPILLSTVLSGLTSLFTSK